MTTTRQQRPWCIEFWKSPVGVILGGVFVSLSAVAIYVWRDVTALNNSHPNGGHKVIEERILDNRLDVRDARLQIDSLVKGQERIERSLLTGIDELKAAIKDIDNEFTNYRIERDGERQAR